MKENIYYNLLEHTKTNNSSLLLTRFQGDQGSIDMNLMKEEVLSTDNLREPLLKEAAMQVMQEGKPTLRYDKAKEQYQFMEPFYPKERLIILGGGHIALPLVQFSARTGFEVIVVDDRPSFANTVRFPDASTVICNCFDKAIDSLTLTVNDYIVVITRGHRHDTECLRHILKQKETIYLGMIGSRRRVGAVKDMLIEEGYDKERINRICTPIGLSIGAITPEEISISILAEIIKRKRLDEVEHHVTNHSDLDYEVIETLANQPSEPYSIVTVIETKGSVPRGVGAKMLVYQTGTIVGSIGGGCSEAAVIHDAISIIGKKRYMIMTIDMTGDVAESDGMVCGGIMKVLIEDGDLHEK